MDKVTPLSLVEIDETLIQQFDDELVYQHAIIPIKQSKTSIVIATHTPDNFQLKDILEQVLQKKVSFLHASFLDLQRHIIHYYEQPEHLSKLQLNDTNSQQQIQQKRTRLIPNRIQKPDPENTPNYLLNYILRHAIINKASDIHIEPGDQQTLIRTRIDGTLHLLEALPKSHHKQLISLIKVEASMNITETRLPQDGEFELEWQEQRFDLRVASAPTVHGEKITVRILNKAIFNISLAELGFSESLLKQILPLTQLP